MKTNEYTATVTTHPADEWSSVETYGYRCTCGAGNVGVRDKGQARTFARMHGCIGERNTYPTVE